MTRCRRLALAVLTLALVATTSTSAWAQGAFYREVEKEGRIYVFNLASEFVLWEKSGELGKAISRPGYGPNGETMIFDSVEAIHLYNFKHNRPGDPAKMNEAPAPKPPAVAIGWKDGKTTIATEFASLVLSNRVQFRYTREMPDGETTLGAGNPISGTAQPRTKGDARDSFRVRRAKMKLEGWFWRKELTYEFQMNFADTSSSLEDAQLTWDVSKNKTFQVKLGQYKVPFGRQQLTSSGSQQFVDRSIVSSEYEKGRDVGLSVQGLLMDRKLDYRLGVFNGNQRNKGANDNNEMQYNGRLVFQPWGDVRYSESDFESTTKPLLALAGRFEINDLRNATTAVDRKYTTWGPELAFKYKGLSVFADAFFRELEPEAQADGTPTPEFGSDGFHLQAGCFLYKRKWEAAVRYATWDPSDLVADNDRTEIGAALNFYENKHNLKVQADVRQIENKATKAKDQELRVQTQWIF